MPDETTRRPVMEVAAITVGAPNPRELVAFYARMLGWRVTADEPPNLALHPRTAGPSCNRRRASRGRR